MPGADQIWLAIAGMTLVVVLTRNAFLIAPRHWQPRGVVERALRYSPLAALVALVVPEVIAPALQPQASWLSVLHDGRLPAAIVLLAAARASRNGFVGLAAGVVVYLSLVGV